MENIKCVKREITQMQKMKETTEEKVKKYLSEIEKNNLKGNKINAILQV